MSTIKLPFSVPRPILACGADMKGSFALATGRTMMQEGPFGDLADPDALARYGRAVRKALRTLRPRAIVRDLHPGYFSSHVAEDLHRALPGTRLLAVQHHEAHVASAIVDHGLAGRVIGVAFDGTGYGTDGAVWGGEFFVGDLRKLERVAHLSYVPMPGAEAAVREPWRMAAAHLRAAYGSRANVLAARCARGVGAAKWRAVDELARRRLHAPLTSSAGRLFDAAGSIILGRYGSAGEAELPMALERIAIRGWADRYDFAIRHDDAGIVVDSGGAFRGMAEDLRRRTGRPVIAGKFHNTVAAMVADTCAALGARHAIGKVVLSGGVFQNRLLTERALFLLSVKGFSVYSHQRVETNDAGIPAGQAAIAAKRFLCA